MKKFIACIALAVALAVSSLANCIAEREYTMEALVIGIDYNTNIVRVIDHNFGIWEFYGTEDWIAGDICILHMNDNGTSKNLYDDIILSAEYIGYIEAFE